MKPYGKSCYNANVELPYLCSCSHETMIDWLDLEVRHISKLYLEEGFTCSNCSRWNTLFYLTLPLEQSIKKLDAMRPTHPSFRYHFVKTVKRAEVIQERGREEAERVSYYNSMG